MSTAVNTGKQTPIDPSDVEKLESLLSENPKILITTHRKPDGDAMGSSLGLWHFLRGRGLDPRIVSPTDFDHFLSWMPGAETVVDAIARPHEARNLAKEADLIFCLDFSGLNRLDNYAKPVEEAEGFKVMVDHHIDPEPVFDMSFHQEGLSSTAEIVYRLIVAMGGKAEINQDIAACLYTGLMTDTGSFRFPSTTPEVHRIAAELLETGIDIGFIHNVVYDNFNPERLRFLGYVLSERMTVIPDLHTSYMVISKADMEKYNLSPGDTEGLVNYNLSMRGIHFGVLMKEGDGKVKMSFRSQGSFPCNKFAANFGGGGHHNASGGRSFESLKETEKKFLGLLHQYKDLLDY